jgi:hypothetical protein
MASMLLRVYGSRGGVAQLDAYASEVESIDARELSAFGVSPAAAAAAAASVGPVAAGMLLVLRLLPAVRCVSSHIWWPVYAKCSTPNGAYAASRTSPARQKAVHR